MSGSIGSFVVIRSGSDGAVAVERRVVLLSRDPGLASLADRLLENGDRVAHFRSATELTDWSEPTVAAVILDSRPGARRLSYKQVRDRFDGPLVMLLDKGEHRPDLPPDGAREFLHRPFQVAQLSKLLAAPARRLAPFEAAIIGVWSRHATEEAARRRGPSYRINWRPSLRRRARAWAATIVALMGLLLVFGVSDQGACTPACTSLGGGAVAEATESPSPQTAPPAAGSGGGDRGGELPASAASSQPPTSPGSALPLVSGVGGMIRSINPITSNDTTPPSGPTAVPGVPAPPGTTPPPTTSPPPGTNPPPTTVPPTTAPPTTEPPTTAPPTTEPPTTAPPTTEPPTTAPPTTEPPTTAPPTTEPPTTAPPTTEPPTTAPPTTEPPATTPPTTEPPATVPPTTVPPTTVPPTTAVTP